MEKELHAYVSGRVQGVGYRYFVEKHAVALRLTGYVKNLIDGRVEVLAQGTEKNLIKLVGYLKQGPSFSRVLNVEVLYSDVYNKFNSFRITY